MREFNSCSTFRLWSAILLAAIAAAACSKDPILGMVGITPHPPTVTAVTPLDAATGVAINNPSITATFSEPMNAPVAANFALTCAAPCVNPTGTVALDATNSVATFTPSTALAPLTQYTATVSGATSLATGLALANPFVWTFTTGATRPTVTVVVPLDNAINVPLNVTTVSAEFDQPMNPITGTASFTVTCAAPCVSPTGTVALDTSKTIATFTLTPATQLSPVSLYTATVSGATSLATGLAIANPFVWHFSTGTGSDTTRPRVTLTVPATTTPGPTPGAPSNVTIAAVFSEDMSPAAINAASFTVTCAMPCISPPGTVSYEVGAKTALFNPTAALTPGATYTATITTAATDLAGNALAGNQAALPAASNYVWTFTAGAAAAAANITVKSISPTAGQTGVCQNATINATFTVPAGLRMDPSRINGSTFVVTGPAPASTPVVAASVLLDAATGTIATFTPQVPLGPTGTYTATIMGGAAGVRDLAVPADDMVSSFVWTFTTGPASGNCLGPVVLGVAAPFGSFGGTAGMTNTGTLTVINGDIGTIATASSSITGFHDTGGDIYTETPANQGAVNGTIYSCTNSTTGPNHAAPNAANCAIATQARIAAQTAYLALAAMPPGANPGGNLASLTLTPGVYTAPAGSFLIEGGDLTLDAQGNANAVFVFQMATTLTVGGPGAAAPQSIILAGGAQPKNVFWQVGSHATINAGGGGTMVGTIISQAGASFSTVGNVAITTLNGRALSLGASVTVVDTVINVPGP
jgi:Ice-binding-like/Bacterial Ig-like domain